MDHSHTHQTTIFNGIDTFTYQAMMYKLLKHSHSNNNCKPTNDAPIANNDYYTTNEDTTINIPAPGILANDTDAENNTLAAEKYQTQSMELLHFIFQVHLFMFHILIIVELIVLHIEYMME